MPLDFSGSSAAKVNCGSAGILDGVHAGTVVAWVRFNNNPPSQISRIYMKGSGATDYRLLHFHANGNLAVQHGRVTTITNAAADADNFAAFGTGKWLCIVGVYDTGGVDGDQQLYVGDEASIVAQPSAYAAQQVGAGTEGNESADDLIIGNEPAGGSNADGEIAFVGLWNRTLSQGEIVQQQFRPLPTAGCIGFWFPGWQGTATQRDYSGRGNNGTVTAATLAAGWPRGVVPGWLFGSRAVLGIPGPALVEKCPVSDLENLDGWTDEGGSGVDLWQSVDDLVTPSTYAQSPA